MNCTFRDNNVGLVVLSGAMPTVENNIFEQNAYCGVMVTGNVFDRATTPTVRTATASSSCSATPAGSARACSLTTPRAPCGRATRL
jgi:parallel beta-helix repeat protein